MLDRLPRGALELLLHTWWMLHAKPHSLLSWNCIGHESVPEANAAAYAQPHGWCDTSSSPSCAWCCWYRSRSPSRTCCTCNPPSSSSSSSPTPHSSSKTEEWYEGKMIEVLDTAKKWLPAEVLKVKKRKGGGHMLFVSYENWDSSWDEWIDTIKAKGRVRPLGITLKESEKEREIRELHEAFRKDLKERYDFEIQDIKGDGNCQFRCFAHQIYGDDEKHLTVRKMCCNHIGEHKEEFENFICVDFEEYLKKKRTPCEWGDDITLTVLLDIFDKNVEIYHQGRFEEKEEDNSKEKRKYYKPGRVERRERKGKENELPIRLSFHENHYNLVIDPRVTYPLGDGKARDAKTNNGGLKEDTTQNDEAR
mmetsp:Transcript_21624/g.30313  ORF Transcript_21624/g.30313 Transcript_21624/m.30313 type:complete len:364 (-) Transcript_21624:211-1302(-)